MGETLHHTAGGREGAVCAKTTGKKFCFQEQDGAELCVLRDMGTWQEQSGHWKESHGMKEKQQSLRAL